MTDRYNTLTVGLERDIRADDAEALIQAIRQLRGVLTVEGNVTDPNWWLAEQRAHAALIEKIWAILYPQKHKSEQEK